MPKSSTERVQEYRKRLKANRPPKNPPKSGLQRARDYRERKRAFKAFVVNHYLSTTPELFTTQALALPSSSGGEFLVNKSTAENNLIVVVAAPNLFSCPECNFQTNWKFGLGHHLKRHYARKSLETNPFDCGKKLNGYTCPRCNFETNLKTISLKHQTKPYEVEQYLKSEGKPFVCSNCKLMTFSKLFLMRHKMRCRNFLKITKRKRPVETFNCVIKSERDGLSNENLAKVTTEGSVVKPLYVEVQWFECSKCPHRAITKAFLREHLRREHPRSRILETRKNEAGKYPCMNCDYIGKTVQCVMKHNKIKHMVLKCLQCEFKTRTAMRLRKHVLEEHTELEWLECKQCDFKTTTNKDLETHEIKHVFKPKPFSCTICQFKGPTENHLVKHLKLKHDLLNVNEWFECSYCSYRTRFKWRVDTHFMKKHNAVLKCSQCEFETRMAMSLRKHVLEEHIELEWLECKQCDFKTTTNQDLETHEQVKHQGIKIEHLDMKGEPGAEAADSSNQNCIVVKVEPL